MPQDAIYISQDEWLRHRIKYRNICFSIVGVESEASIQPLTMVGKEASLVWASTRGGGVWKMGIGQLLALIWSCAYCEAHRHRDENAFVVGEVTDNSDALISNNITDVMKPTVNSIIKPQKKHLDRAVLDRLDLPLDAFTLHHPFLHSSITEFEYSQWYFLFFVFFDKPSRSSIDVSLTVPEISKSLSSKLSVAASVFSISRAEKYRTKSISANLSLTNHTITGLHHNLCNLQNTSPLFWIRATRYKLVAVVHDKNKHLYVRKMGQVINLIVLEVIWLGQLIRLSDVKWFPY